MSFVLPPLKKGIGGGKGIEASSKSFKRVAYKMTAGI